STRQPAAATTPAPNPKQTDPAPGDQETVEALPATADLLTKVAGNEQGQGAEAARRLSRLLLRLAQVDPPLRKQAETTIVEPLRFSLDQLRQELKPQRITIETLPRDLAREWLTPDGRARVQVLPQGDPDDTAVLPAFLTPPLALPPHPPP